MLPRRRLAGAGHAAHRLSRAGQPRCNRRVVGVVLWRPRLGAAGLRTGRPPSAARPRGGRAGAVVAAAATL